MHVFSRARVRMERSDAETAVKWSQADTLKEFLKR